MSDLSIRFDNVSKFYGEVLGINRVDLKIPPGITSLVGPNGSGKTTLMNLVCGLLQPSQGKITVRGIATDDPEHLFRELGYCTQYDSFPRGIRGMQFIISYLRVHGYTVEESRSRAEAAITKVNLTAAADRRIAAFSKGMRQRIKLAQAIAHDPSVLILDEPLNGLDPMARAEMIGMFKEMAQAGKNIVISSHILHEVDMISDQVILLNEGYVVAEGGIRDVRGEMKKHPLQILIRCDQASLVASRAFEMDSVVEVKIDEDGKGLLLKTRDANQFFSRLNHLVLENGIRVERVAPADDDVQAVYQYLIGQDKGGS